MPVKINSWMIDIGKSYVEFITKDDVIEYIKKHPDIICELENMIRNEKIKKIQKS